MCKSADFTGVNRQSRLNNFQIDLYDISSGFEGDVFTGCQFDGEGGERAEKASSNLGDPSQLSSPCSLQGEMLPSPYSLVSVSDGKIKKTTLMLRQGASSKMF